MKCKLCGNEIAENIFLKLTGWCQKCDDIVYAAKEKNQIKVVAIDSKGNRFDKVVEIKDYSDEILTRKVISFGWPCEYNFEDLIKDCPFKKDLCIDISGTNHAGVPGVCIKKEDMNRIIEIFLIRMKRTVVKD